MRYCPEFFQGSAGRPEHPDAAGVFPRDAAPQGARHLLPDLQRLRLVGIRHEELDQPREGRIAQLPAKLDLLFEKAGVVLPRASEARNDRDRRIGSPLSRAASPLPCSPGHLGQQLEGPLGGTEIREGRPQSAATTPTSVTSGSHGPWPASACRPGDPACRAEIEERAPQRSAPPRGIAVQPRDASPSGEAFAQDLLELLRSDSHEIDVLAPAARAARREHLLRAAVVADQAGPILMVGQRNAAVRAAEKHGRSCGTTANGSSPGG